ncbi:unnamed protein product [Polarella glacialis]|uniref:ATP-dependent transporter ycf16 n=1 Tax=Polarella glacialis TaxID=89957 RepID=A0A813JZB0_POLGL|nr:unnamed protein product [Polarella glacialis]
MPVLGLQLPFASRRSSFEGAVVEPVDVRSKIAYVMQDYAMPPLSTPRELLHMSAVLRRARDPAAVTQQVRELLEALRLQKCADTLVGSSLVRGISGGEKKRTSVAVELITRPRMIFLDEPLSGLDSYAAWTVVQVLRELAEHGCAVLCTMHQPSSDIFETFQEIICLAEGRVVYFGTATELISYMEQAGRPVPTHLNPADHILFQVQIMSMEDLRQFAQSWAAVENSSILPRIQQVRAAGTAPGSALQPLKRKSFGTQLAVLVRREFKATMRDRTNLVARFAVNAIMGLFVCLHVCRDRPKEQHAPRYAVAFWCNLPDYDWDDAWQLPATAVAVSV